MLDTTLPNFLICGLVRNCEKTLRSDIIRISKAFRSHGNVQWLVVESDSDDQTITQLEELKSEIDNFQFLSLGTLQPSIPDRTARIAHCRNAYLAEVFDNQSFAHTDFVVVCDLDGLNTEIDENAIATCWSRDDWDVVAANQRGPYYDIFALRHPAWCPGDCLEQFEFLQMFRNNKHRNQYSAIHALMLSIPPDADWISVDSAFGGLAIYRKEILRGLTYRGTDLNGKQICEHVTLHSDIKAANGKIFINPALLNANYTEHTETLRPMRRLQKNLLSFLKRPIQTLFS